MIKLTREEMLAEWKRRKGMIPVSTSTLEITGSVSDTVDEMLLSEIDDWYARLLLTEPVDMLPVRDIAPQTEVVDMGDGSVEVRLPDSCVRVVIVRMSGWLQPARIVEPDSATARMQSSRYVSGKTHAPVAVRHGRKLTLYGNQGGAALSELRCVAPPADGSYELERALLAGIDNFQSVCM